MGSYGFWRDSVKVLLLVLGFNRFPITMCSSLGSLRCGSFGLLRVRILRVRLRVNFSIFYITCMLYS